MQSNRMVTGFNHNIKHRGRTFHVQTEDSGLGNPHIITHLFVGGNILASKKTSYADILSAENLREVVRAMMEEQHKELLRNLINGGYDELIDRHGSRAWQPGNVDQAVARAPAAPTAPAPPATPAASLQLDLGGADVLGDNIFGEDLISERSLDDVILSYLSDDPVEP